jgi:hypothetical protein
MDGNLGFQIIISIIPTFLIPTCVRYETYRAKEASYAFGPRRLTMTGQFLEMREQALTLLKIEREQILENIKHERKRSAGKRNLVTRVRPLLILNRSCGSAGGKPLSQ